VVSQVETIAMAGGHLLTGQTFDEVIHSLASRTVQWGGTSPTVSDPTMGNLASSPDCATQAACAPITALPDGSYAQVLHTGDTRGDIVTVSGPTSYEVQPGASGGTLADADGPWVVYDNAANHTQYIGTNTAPSLPGNLAFSRPMTAAALLGGLLVTPDTAPGALTLTDLATQEVRQSLPTGAACTPTDVQTAASRWIYWSCGTTGPAGVWDLTTGTDIPVPSGLAQLADGYLVVHDTAAGKLELTDFHTGTASAATDLADLPAGTLTDDRKVTWAVDKNGGGVAYVDAQNNIHVIDPHIPATPTSTVPDPGLSLLQGEELTAGHSISSASVRLVMQADGNLVAYLRTSAYPGAPAVPLWSTGTSGHPGAYALMQPDGNLVLYRAGGGPATGGALWSTGTFGHPGAHTVLQDDGNLVTYSPTGTALWSTGTYARPQTLAVGTVLKPGWWAQAKYTHLVMQPDGNLVIYRNRDGAPLWSTGTSGHPGGYAVMQPDGNLVIYRPGSTALWSTKTSGHPGAYAIMQDDGNFVVYRAGGGPTTGGALWSTGTYKTAQ
jgi:hypothetical protein